MTHLYNCLSYHSDSPAHSSAHARTLSRLPPQLRDTDMERTSYSRLCTRLYVHTNHPRYRQNRTHPRMHGRRQAPRGCAVRAGNPTNVQHVYVSPVTLTLQFMHASTARRPLSALPDRPQLTGSLNTTANLPTRFNVQVQSPRGVHNRLPFGFLPTFVRSYLYFGARSVLLLCRARHPTYARTPLWIFR